VVVSELLVFMLVEDYYPKGKRWYPASRERRQAA